MKKLLLALVLVLPGLAMAENLTIQAQPAEFNVVHITTSKVKGVSVSLSQIITRDDCNRRSISFEVVAVEGNKDVAWHQLAYVSASTMMTEMNCPLDKPVTETIYSRPVVLNSLINSNVNGEVNLRLIVPPGYRVNVEEVLK